MKDINSYLQDKRVSQNAKEYYKGLFKAKDDTKTQSIIDSLRTKNNETRPFYLYLVSRMSLQSDGALSETLGMALKNMVEKKPDAAIPFLFASTSTKGNAFINSWAKLLAGEFKIDCEDNERACINRSLFIALGEVKSANAANLKRFYDRVCHFSK